MLLGVAFGLRKPGGVLLFFGPPLGGPKATPGPGQHNRKENSFLNRWSVYEPGEG